MLPTMLLIIPIFLIYARTDLYDTFTGLILASTAWTLPYAILLLRSFFLDVPVSLEEQALVDGCSRVGAFFRVTVPLSLAGLVAVLVFVFIWTWGDMLFPLILAKNIDRQTAALSLFTMMQSTRERRTTAACWRRGSCSRSPPWCCLSCCSVLCWKGSAPGALKE